MNEILYIILLTFAPFLELRASIPYGLLATDVSPVVVVLLAVIVNIALAPILYVFLDKFVHLFLKIGFVKRIWDRIVERTQKRIHKAVDRYGWLGVAIFIGIPLPGSGVYSGALGSYLIGLSFKKFMIAAIIGVLIAATAVTVVVLSGSGLAGLFVKMV